MKIHFISSLGAKSKSAFLIMVSMYGQSELCEADVIVVLSGDGMVLRAFHETYKMGIPVYGMNRGGLGFLTNKYKEENLIERISVAKSLNINPLRVSVHKDNKDTISVIAVNELYLFRETHQTAKIKVKINDKVRINELVCDGLIAATATGSTAYNYSAHGVILPPNSELIALTPISPFRPRGWRGALLQSDFHLEFEVIERDRRPVSAVADYDEFRDVSKVQIFQDKSINLSLLFDEDNLLENKILLEQFAT